MAWTGVGGLRPLPLTEMYIKLNQRTTERAFSVSAETEIRPGKNCRNRTKTEPSPKQKPKHFRPKITEIRPKNADSAEHSAEISAETLPKVPKFCRKCRKSPKLSQIAENRILEIRQFEVTETEPNIRPKHYSAVH